jgi:hypothetical protein
MNNNRGEIKNNFILEREKVCVKGCISFNMKMNKKNSNFPQNYYFFCILMIFSLIICIAQKVFRTQNFVLFYLSAFICDTNRKSYLSFKFQ